LFQDNKKFSTQRFQSGQAHAKDQFSLISQVIYE